jgi:hypothetical protein
VVVVRCEAICIWVLLLATGISRFSGAASRLATHDEATLDKIWPG